jgi:hypothetical protein
MASLLCTWARLPESDRMETTRASQDSPQTREISAYFVGLWLAVGLGSSVA